MQKLLDDVFILDSNGKVIQPLESFYPMILNGNKINVSSIQELAPILNYLKANTSNKADAKSDDNMNIEDVEISSSYKTILKKYVEDHILMQLNSLSSNISDMTTYEYRDAINRIKTLVVEYQPIVENKFEKLLNCNYKSFKTNLANFKPKANDEIAGRTTVITSSEAPDPNQASSGPNQASPDPKYRSMLHTQFFHQDHLR